MKEQLQNGQLNNSSRKSLGAGSIEPGRRAPDGASLEDGHAPARQMVGLTLVRWRAETVRLQKGVCWCNPWRGIPTGWQFDQLYRQGYGPEAALTAWRDWQPWDDYTPLYDESWPPHDYD